MFERFHEGLRASGGGLMRDLDQLLFINREGSISTF